jgi:DNA-binding NarL/FixJ family response regulator
MSPLSGHTVRAAMRKVRVLIVDDHHLFTQAVGALLDQDPEIEVTGCVHDGASALDAAHQADVVLMDMTMPAMDGLEATRRLLARNPRLRIVAVSGDGDGEAAARAAGATSFLHKGDLHDEVAAAVRRAAAA